MKDAEMLAALVGVREAMAEDFTDPEGEPTGELAQLDAVIAALSDPPLAEDEDNLYRGPGSNIWYLSGGAYELAENEPDDISVTITVRKKLEVVIS